VEVLKNLKTQISLGINPIQATSTKEPSKTPTLFIKAVASIRHQHGTHACIDIELCEFVLLT